MNRWLRQLSIRLHFQEFAAFHLDKCRRGIRRLSGVDQRIIREYLAGNAIKKLQLGCGDHVMSGWLNSSLNFGRKDILHLDVTERFPFEPSTFDYVFSEHLIEHVPFPAGRHMLTECHRILKPGGRVRITTPDISFLFSLYNNGHSELGHAYIRWACERNGGEIPYEDPVFVINNFVRAWGHQFIYDENTLRFALKAAGFEGVVKRELNASDDPHLRDLENEGRMPAGFLKLESLTLEAEKGPAQIGATVAA